MSQWGQILFQDASSPVMLHLISFHDHACILLTLILSIIGFNMLDLFTNKFTDRFVVDAHNLELIWTVCPASVLLVLAGPSLQLLYITDEIVEPTLTIKVVGHQWYWSYEYSDFSNIEFDSYMVPTFDLSDGEFRLLEVDNRIAVPMKMYTRMLITAADVIHSWTVPALGIKVDAVPGRLNQVIFATLRPGVFYGQCSEICGANHSFMPIAMEVVDSKSFMKWISSFNS
uniref:Cytochrome c oxidase subunit 2 n=1 Tax=Moniligastridae sp. YN201757-04 TaxID=2484775 RepID=A0A6B7PZB0_9ANNE|nr:cytochrome oxidase subunit II [Moniligastridae sp. YN201757-04]